MIPANGLHVKELINLEGQKNEKAINYTHVGLAFVFLVIGVSLINQNPKHSVVIIFAGALIFLLYTLALILTFRFWKNSTRISTTSKTISAPSA